MDNRYVAEAVRLLEDLLKRNDPEGFGCACWPGVTGVCGPCTAAAAQQPINAAIALLRTHESGVALPALPCIVNDANNAPEGCSYPRCQCQLTRDGAVCERRGARGVKGSGNG